MPSSISGWASARRCSSSSARSTSRSDGVGLQVTSAENGAGWPAFLRELTARGLAGVQVVTSDAHRGMVDAVGAALPGAGWQRCRTHCAANLVAVSPRNART